VTPPAELAGATNGLAERRLREHVVLARSWHTKNAGPRPKRYNGAWDDLCDIGARIVEAREVPSSLRYVFYRLVTLDLLQNTDSEYSALSDNTARARRQGSVPSAGRPQPGDLAPLRLREPRRAVAG